MELPGSNCESIHEVFLPTSKIARVFWGQALETKSGSKNPSFEWKSASVFYICSSNIVILALNLMAPDDGFSVLQIRRDLEGNMGIIIHLALGGILLLSLRKNKEVILLLDRISKIDARIEYESYVDSGWKAKRSLVWVCVSFTFLLIFLTGTAIIVWNSDGTYLQKLSVFLVTSFELTSNCAQSMTYILLCFELARRFTLLRNNLKRQLTTGQHQQVETIRILHWELCRCLRLLESAFGPLMWSILLYAIYFVTVHTFIAIGEGLSSERLRCKPYFLFWIGNIAFLIAYSTYYMIRESKSIITEGYLIATEGLQKELKFQVQYLVQQVNYSELRVLWLGVFHLDLKFLMLCTKFFIAYVVAINQFSPTIQETIFQQA